MNILFRRINAVIIDYGFYYFLTIVIMNVILGEEAVIKNAELLSEAYLSLNEGLLNGEISGTFNFNTSTFIDMMMIENVIKIVAGFILFVLFPIFLKGRTLGHVVSRVIILKPSELRRLNYNRVVVIALFDRWIILSLLACFLLFFNSVNFYIIMNIIVVTIYSLYVICNIVVMLFTKRSILDHLYNSQPLIAKRI